MMARCAFIAAVLTASATRAAPTSRSAQKAPNSQTDLNPPLHKRRRVAAFLGPAPADFTFLADPALILHPDFDMHRLGMFIFARTSGNFSLNAAWATGSASWCLGRQTSGTRFIAWSRVRTVSGLMQIPHLSFTKSTM